MATSAQDAINAIRKANGFVSHAAAALGISRTQLYRIINDKPTVKEALVDSREAMKDFAESKLFANIKDGKEASIFFYLKTQARHRGWVDKQEVQHSGDATSPIRFITEDRNVSDSQ